MYSNVVGAEHDVTTLGDSLEVTFDPVTPEVTLPRLRRTGVHFIYRHIKN
jgi:hypothetical protein